MRKQKYFNKNVELFNPAGNNVISVYTCSMAEAEQICLQLSNRNPEVTGAPDEDVYNIFVGVNIWCNLFAEVTGELPDMLFQRIRLIGLQNAIAEADEHRLFLLSEGVRGLRSMFWQRWFNLSLFEEENDLIFQDNWRKALSVLGCIRKIRLTCLDYTFMFEEFLKTNRKCGSFNKTPWIDYGSLDGLTAYQRMQVPSSATSDRTEWERAHPTAGSRLLDDLASIIHLIFENWEQDSSLFTLPPGASYEGAHSYLEKFKYVEQQQEWLRDRGVNIPLFDNNFDTHAVPADCSRYITVPKSYKTGRGVAPEPVSRQVLGYQISSGMRKCLKKIGIDLNDQTKNQRACAVAYQDKLATVDKSSASDLISYELVVQLFKYDTLLLKRLKDCRSNYIQLRNKRYKSCRFFTMGNAATFDTETSIFLAIAIYVGFWHSDISSFYTRKGKLRKRVEGEPFNVDLKRFIAENHIAVYGDDVIIPCEWYETYCSIAEKLGFEINKTKSYSDPYCYRESCGVEFMYNIYTRNSLDVTGIYYPRGISRKALPELLGLQHKYVDFPLVDYFLTGLILDVFPEMTTSEIPEDRALGAFDIWTTFPNLTAGEGSPYGMFACICHVTWLEKQTKIQLSGRPTLLRKEGYFLTYGAHRSYGIFKALEKALTTNYVPGSARIVSEKTFLQTLSNEDFLDDTPEHRGSVHAVLTSRSTGKIPQEEAERVERLMYLLSIGNGIDHINSSDYTEQENMIRDSRDLVSNREVYVTFKTLI